MHVCVHTFMCVPVKIIRWYQILWSWSYRRLYASKRGSCELNLGPSWQQHVILAWAIYPAPQSPLFVVSCSDILVLCIFCWMYSWQTSSYSAWYLHSRTVSFVEQKPSTVWDPLSIADLTSHIMGGLLRKSIPLPTSWWSPLLCALNCFRVNKIVRLAGNWIKL